MILSVKKTHPDAVLPHYATSGAACLDLHAATVTGPLLPGDAVVVGTGLAFEIPHGYVMLVFSRSGHGFNHDIRLANCVGVIDSDYRGEVMLKLRNDRSAEDERPAIAIRPGDRVAQAMILPLPSIDRIRVVDELSNTERGAGGFGSTGA
jgi:dUTP pyrophosphatase